MDKVTVRFAPSPTGYLHLGGARTALYNWLYVRQKKGVFRLRIEDTDIKRSTEESVKAIMDGLKWLGLDWDGDVILQSSRREIHRQWAYKLLKAGLAYKCSCTPEQLEAKRKEAAQQGLQPRYDRTCREKNIPENIPCAIRFKAPLEGTTTFYDLIHGEITVPNSEIDDFIILRSDGIPTYNFSVVIDDHDMEISHVIRGDDHLTNTPKQIKIYEAIGWKPPVFAHLPLVAGLSKRKGAESIQDYRARGFLPQAVVNYIVRLGWGFKDQEVFTMEELLEKFRLEDVGKSRGQVNEEKLLWLNGQHIRLLPVEKFAELLKSKIEEKGWKIKSQEWFQKATASIQPRCNTLEEAIEKMRYYFDEQMDISEALASKYLTEEIKEILRRYASFIATESFESREKIEQITMKFLEKEKLKLKMLALPLRVVLSGVTDGPGLFDIMEILGKETVIKRLKKI